MSKGLRATWQNIRDAVSVWGAGILLFAIALAAALQFVGPPPPDRIVIATGAEGGAYRHYGELLAARLNREGIEVELRETAGSVENLELLQEDESVDLGFVQGGLAATHPAANIVALGSLYLEPLWMFARTGFGLDSAAELDRKRIAQRRCLVRLPHDVRCEPVAPERVAGHALDRLEVARDLILFLPDSLDRALVDVAFKSPRSFPRFPGIVQERASIAIVGLFVERPPRNRRRFLGRPRRSHHRDNRTQ